MNVCHALSIRSGASIRVYQDVLLHCPPLYCGNAKERNYSVWEYGGRDQCVTYNPRQNSRDFIFCFSVLNLICGDSGNSEGGVRFDMFFMSIGLGITPQFGL